MQALLVKASSVNRSDLLTLIFIPYLTCVVYIFVFIFSYFIFSTLFFPSCSICFNRGRLKSGRGQCAAYMIIYGGYGYTIFPSCSICFNRGRLKSGRGQWAAYMVIYGYMATQQTQTLCGGLCYLYATYIYTYVERYALIKMCKDI